MRPLDNRHDAHRLGAHRLGAHQLDAHRHDAKRHDAHQPPSRRGLRRALLLLALLPLLLAACAPRVLPEFRGVTLVSVQPDFDAASLRLELDLRFRFRNPLTREITVPAHQFRLLVDNQELPGGPALQPAFAVPAEGERDVTYRFTLDLSPTGALAPLQLLGRDVPYAFAADVIFELPLGLSAQTLELRYDDSVRLPLLPTLTLDTRPGAPLPSATLLGDLELIDLSPVQEAMAPFIELLLGIGDVLVPTLAPVLYGPFPSEQQNEQLQDDWEAFKQSWQDLLDVDARLLDPLASELEGVRLTVPLILRNPNDFAIAAPSFDFALSFGVGAPLAAVRARYPAPLAEIPGNNVAVPVVLESELRWSVFGAGLLGLVQGQTETVALDGTVAVDLGYGLVRVPIEIASLPLQLGP